jgi:hypothetical protein
MDDWFWRVLFADGLESQENCPWLFFVGKHSVFKSATERALSHNCIQNVIEWWSGFSALNAKFKSHL